jgi:hypothetical protein
VHDDFRCACAGAVEELRGYAFFRFSMVTATDTSCVRSFVIRFDYRLAGGVTEVDRQFC